MNEKISIIVPVFNAKQYIEETIQTVEEQTYCDWELILVDDGSTDGTREILAHLAHSRVKIICQPSNQGAAKARNKGLLEATGRYIAFLDADDLWKKDKLEKTLAFLKSKQAAFVFTSYEFADEKGRGNGKVAHVPPILTYREALKNTIIFTTTVLFDTAKISKEELQMPSIKSEDTATWWRILRSGYQAYGLDEVLVYYRRTGQTLSSNKVEAIRRIWSLYRKVEGLSIWYSSYNFVFYAIRTTLRRL